MVPQAIGISLRNSAAINGKPIPLQPKCKKFPIQIGNVCDQISLYRMDDVSEDCVLGSLWLQKVSPYLVNHDKLTFTCKLNGQFVTLPMSFQPIRKCKTIEPPIIIQPPLAQ